jgi:hypothetical protein
VPTDGCTFVLPGLGLGDQLAEVEGVVERQATHLPRGKLGPEKIALLDGPGEAPAEDVPFAVDFRDGGPGVIG